MLILRLTSLLAIIVPSGFLTIAWYLNDCGACDLADKAMMKHKSDTRIILFILIGIIGISL
jgi:hypothetical protein